jgi:hypothetical protein
MYATKEEAIQCSDPVHLIDRRSKISDANGRLIDNWQCACRQLKGNAADYRGGEFDFVFLKEDDEEEGAATTSAARHGGRKSKAPKSETAE